MRAVASDAAWVAKSAAGVAGRAAAGAAGQTARVGKAVASNPVVQDLVVDAIEQVLPRTAKRVEKQLRPAAKKAEAKKAAVKKAAVKKAPVKKAPAKAVGGRKKSGTTKRRIPPAP